MQKTIFLVSSLQLNGIETMLGCYADTRSLKGKDVDYVAYVGKVLDTTGEYLLAINKYMHRL